MKIIALLLLCSCLPATVNAGVRRMAETRLRACLKRAGESLDNRDRCRQESYAYCLRTMPKNHIEKGCGLNWTDGDFK